MFEEFDALYEERLKKGNEAVLEALKSLDHTSPTYADDLEAVSKLAQQVKDDFKNYNNIEIGKCHVLDERERRRNELIDTVLRSVLGVLGLAGTVGMFFTDLKNYNIRIDKVAKFEEKDAILKTADKIAVSDALKREKKTFSFPFFWK